MVVVEVGEVGEVIANFKVTVTTHTMIPIVVAAAVTAVIRVGTVEAVEVEVEGLITLTDHRVMAMKLHHLHNPPTTPPTTIMIVTGRREIRPRQCRPPSRPQR